jgi:hypothetical protein
MVQILTLNLPLGITSTVPLKTKLDERVIPNCKHLLEKRADVGRNPALILRTRRISIMCTALFHCLHRGDPTAVDGAPSPFRRLGVQPSKHRWLKKKLERTVYAAWAAV